MKNADMGKHLTGSREECEAWIRDTIGRNFRWRVRPRDTPENRKMVADLILSEIENGGGVFPGSNAFIERVQPKRRDGNC